MQILLINHSFPGLFGPLLRVLADGGGHEFLFVSSYTRRKFTLPGLRHVQISSSTARTRSTGQEVDKILLAGQQALRTLACLEKTDFSPDILLAHGGCGYAAYWKDAFPDALRVTLIEDAQGLPGHAQPQGMARAFLESRLILSSDYVLCLTAFGQSSWSRKLANCVDLPCAIDTGFFVPRRVEHFLHGEQDLAGCEECLVVPAHRTLADTTAFMKRLVLLLGRRRQCHLRFLCVSTGTWQALSAGVQTLPPELGLRMHVFGSVSSATFRTLLQLGSVLCVPPQSRLPASTVLEAMSCGTVPVLFGREWSTATFGKEAVQLADYHDRPDEAFARLEHLLEDRKLLQELGLRARAHVVEHYEEARVAPLHAAAVLQCARACRRRDRQAAARDSVAETGSPS